MIKANITFYGIEKDKYGMPKPFNRYYIFVSPFEDDSSYCIASVINFNGSPLLNNPHIMFKGTSEEALHQMMNKLRNLGDNKNLKELFHQE